MDYQTTVHHLQQIKLTLQHVLWPGRSRDIQLSRDLHVQLLEFHYYTDRMCFIGPSMLQNRLFTLQYPQSSKKQRKANLYKKSLVMAKLNLLFMREEQTVISL